MALINGKLDGKIVGTNLLLGDNQNLFPFRGRWRHEGPFLVFNRPPSYIFEVSLSDALTIITDSVGINFVKAILLEDSLYIFDDSITADKIRSLFVTITDHLTEFSDSVDSYKYIGYIFLKDGVKFEIKRH